MKNFNLTKLAVVMGIMVSAIFISCEEREQEINLAENEAQRQEVYDQILSDEELFNEFMGEMTENRDMMRNMYTREQVEAMMLADPDIIDSVVVGMYSVMERDTMMRQNPERRERMMRNMMNMMERDTAMHRMMQERMQERHMGNME